MAVSKCGKCGANIPKEAKFCPACGAPKTEKPAPQQAVAAPSPQPVPKGQNSIHEILNTLFTDLNIFIMILLGLLFACIGGLLVTFSSSNSTLYQIALILNVLGFVFMSIFLLMGGLVNKNFDNYVRFGMIVGGAIMLTWSLAIPA